MKSQSTSKCPPKSLLIFSLAVFVSVFIILAKTTNMYSLKVGGAIFEMLWLPVLALAFALPVYILVLFVKNSYRFKPLHLFSLVVLVVAITFMVLYK